MPTNLLIPRLTHRTRVAVATGAVIATAVAVLAVAAQAQATELTNAFYVHVETTAAAPAVAPNYVAGGEVIPNGPGSLGNPFALTLPNGQALGVQNGSTAWGTPVVSENPTGKSNEAWRLYRVGWIAVWPDCTGGSNCTHDDQLSDGTPLGTGEPVYKIINYASGGHTCLDAAGDNPAPGAAVTSYGCDPNQVNQTNQLWMIGANPDYEFSANHNAVDMTNGELLPGSLVPAYTNAISDQAEAAGQYTLTNVASLLADEGQPAQAMILSSGDNVNGTNSPSIVSTPANASTSNSLYELRALVPPAGSPPTNCAGIACLFAPAS
jgi:hypothetical protein